MTTADEILPELRSAMHNLLGPKNKIRLGTWNVRTMYATSKAAQVLNEMEKYQLDILGMRMRWMGHVFRMEPDRTAKIALRWTPPGERKPGRPRTTWRRTITTELAEDHLTLGEAQNRAKDRLWWKQFLAALCPTGGEEE